MAGWTVLTAQDSKWPSIKIEGDLWPQKVQNVSRLLNSYPKKIDLSIYLPEVGDQGKGLCCSAFASIWVMKSIADNSENGYSNTTADFFLNKENYIYTPIFNYGLATKYSKTDCGQGVSLKDCFLSLITYGAIKLSDWKTQNIDNPCICNPRLIAEFEKKAAINKISNFIILNSISNEDLIKQLVRGYSIGIEFRIPKEFEELGYEKKWNRVLNFSKLTFGKGFHSAVIVGYDIEKKNFKVANSYGKEWGDSGYFYLNFDFWKKTDKDVFKNDRNILSTYYLIQNDLDPIKNEIHKLLTFPFTYKEKEINYYNKNKIVCLERGEYSKIGKYKFGCFDLDSSKVLLTIYNNETRLIILNQEFSKCENVSIRDEENFFSIELLSIAKPSVFYNKSLAVFRISIDNILTHN